MDEQRDNPEEIDSSTAQPPAAAESTSAVNDTPVSEMPMLAGNAAARLASQIVGRLASPHAAPTSSPIHAGSLWRQITHRLGAASDERPHVGAPLVHSLHPLGHFAQLDEAEPAQPLDPLTAFWGPQQQSTKFIWRTRARHGAEMEPEPQPGGARRPPLLLPSSRILQASMGQPTPVTLPQTPTPVAPVPPPAPALTSAVAEPSAPAPESAPAPTMPVPSIPEVPLAPQPLVAEGAAAAPIAPTHQAAEPALSGPDLVPPVPSITPAEQPSSQAVEPLPPVVPAPVPAPSPVPEVPAAPFAIPMAPASPVALSQASETESAVQRTASVESESTSESAPVAPAAVEPPRVTEAGRPPVLVPARVVRVEYAPGPAVVPPEPLTSTGLPLTRPPALRSTQPALPEITSAPLTQPVLEEPGEQIISRLTHTLASEVGQQLVPTTDLLSRMVRTPDLELPPPTPARPLPTDDVASAISTASAPTAAPAPAVSTLAEPPVQPLQREPSLFPDEEQRLPMPLAARPARSARQQEQAKSAEELIAQAERGPVGRLWDRVVSALPIPEGVRRFMTGSEHREAPADTGTPTSAAPPSPIAEVSQPTPVQTARAAEVTPAPAPPLAVDPSVSAPTTTPASSAPAPLPTGQTELTSTPAITVAPATQAAQPESVSAPAALSIPGTYAPSDQPVAPAAAVQALVPETTVTSPVQRAAEPVVSQGEPTAVLDTSASGRRGGSDTATAAPVEPAPSYDITSSVGQEAPAEGEAAIPTAGDQTHVERVLPADMLDREPEPVHRGPQGLLGGLLDRLFGRGSRDQQAERSGPPALAMPVRRGRAAEPAPEEEGDLLRRAEIPSVRVVESQLAPPQPPAAPVPSQPQVVAQREVATGDSAVSSTAPEPSTAVSPEPVSTSPAYQAPQAEPERAAPSIVPPPAVEATAALPLQRASTEQPHVESQTTEAATAAQLSEQIAEALPGIVKAHVQETLGEPVGPSHVETGPASVPVAEAPSASPGVGPPTATEVAPHTPAQTLEEATTGMSVASTPQVTAQPQPVEQAWMSMSDFAEEVAQAHAPLASGSPVGTASQGGLLARLLSRLGQVPQTPQVALSGDWPPAVPTPLRGVGTHPAPDAASVMLPATVVGMPPAAQPGQSQAQQTGATPAAPVPALPAQPTALAASQSARSPGVSPSVSVQTVRDDSAASTSPGAPVATDAAAQSLAPAETTAAPAPFSETAAPVPEALPPTVQVSVPAPPTPSVSVPQAPAPWSPASLASRPPLGADALRDIRTTTTPLIPSRLAGQPGVGESLPFGPAAGPSLLSMPMRSFAPLSAVGRERGWQTGMETSLAQPGLTGSGYAPGAAYQTQASSYAAPGVPNASISTLPGGFAAPVASPMPLVGTPSPAAPGVFRSPAPIGSSARTTIMRSLGEMAPALSSQLAEMGSAESIGDDGGFSEHGSYLEALQAFYGDDQDHMPLAMPFGAFVVPGATEQPFPAWASALLDNVGAGVDTESSIAGDGQSAATLGLGVPSTPSSSWAGRGPSSSFSSPSFSSPSFTSPAPSYFGGPTSALAGPSWSISGSWASEAAEPGYAGDYGAGGGEEGAWADVVATAASDSYAGSSSLALAAEERGSEPSQTQQDHANTGEHHDAPQVDELADSVYDIIRRRLMIEQEREFA